MNIKEIIRTELKKYLTEGFRPINEFAVFIRSQLELIYRPLGLWGHAPNPNNDCQTNLGVINIFPHSENDSWSVLNRFDTNKKVEKKMREIFYQTNPEDKSQKAFEDWISENSEDLFGPDGLYTQELVDLNMDTIISGNKREEFAVRVLQDRFPNVPIKRYCSGDVRDTKKGIDITVELPTKPYNIQVKPFTTVNSYFEPNGDTFFEVKSYLEVNKYSETNVQVFFFVNNTLDKFILFINEKTKIGQMSNDIIRFYEPPLFTNITFKTKQKRKKNKFDDIEKLFGLDNSLEKNLEFRSQTLQKLLQDLRNQKK